MEHHAVMQLEYLGSAYSGWAHQPDRPSIEGSLDAALAAIGASEVRIRCAGRTDAGVHATGQVVDVRYLGPVPPGNLSRALMSTLPSDVAVLASEEAPTGFDARRHATSRSYEYRVLTRSAPSPVRAAVAFHHPRALDFDILQASARHLTGSHDFRAFTPSRTEHRGFIRSIVASEWRRTADELVYRVQAAAFLRNQVRVMVGSMLAAARGEIDVEQFVGLLDGGTRADAPATAPARGLCLVGVTYAPVAGLALKPGWSAPAALPFSTRG